MSFHIHGVLDFRGQLGETKVDDMFMAFICPSSTKMKKDVKRGDQIMCMAFLRCDWVGGKEGGDRVFESNRGYGVRTI